MPSLVERIGAGMPRTGTELAVLCPGRDQVTGYRSFEYELVGRTAAIRAQDAAM